MELLAQLGGRGSWLANTQRDLDNILNLEELGAPDVYNTRVPVYHSTATPPRTIDQEWPIRLPHELVACLFARHRRDFDEFIRGPDGAVEAYWNGFKNKDPRLFRHPIKLERNYHKRAMPLRT